MTEDEIVEVMARAMYARVVNTGALGEDWKVYEPEAKASLAALTANGLCVVPIEPSEAMILQGGIGVNYAWNVADIYRAMIAVKE